LKAGRSLKEQNHQGQDRAEEQWKAKPAGASSRSRTDSCGVQTRTPHQGNRYNAETLDAAKAYKRVTSVSFYQLGLESIRDRLAKEGYFNRATEPKQPSPETEGAKA
jgi:hypothetical protein